MKKNRRHIAFIGDSFCASIKAEHWLERGSNANQSGVTSPAWPSLVADRLGLIPDYHGYFGKSWWYSRHHFFKQCKHLLLTNQFEAIIFCHTDYYRMNSLVDSLAPNPIVKTPEDKILAKAQNLWRVYLCDPEHQRWCQNNWLIEIKKTFAHVPKIIQFTNFTPDLIDQDNCLGMCYRTPLIWLQIGEYKGSDQQVQDQIGNLYTANHLNDNNNIKMADFIIEAITNYRPGIYEIDLARFDRVNLNAANWAPPHYQGFGTE